MQQFLNKSAFDQDNKKIKMLGDNITSFILIKDFENQNYTK